MCASHLWIVFLWTANDGVHEGISISVPVEVFKIPIVELKCLKLILALRFSTPADLRLLFELKRVCSLTIN